jgi:tRNA threonylcarbamoyladenosine biosynthesis protein TsaB
MVTTAWGGLTLALDACTYEGSVAVLSDGVLVATGSALMRGELEERLMPALLATVASAGYALRDVARVVCGAGPGSFTSLRIAGAIAKGIAMGNGAPLFAVSSLALLATGAEPALAPGRWVAMLDAMRDERHAALVEIRADGSVREGERIGRISATDIPSLCARLHARPVGPLETTAARPHARGVVRLLGPIAAAGPVSLDGWEPDYGRLAEAQVKWELAHGRALRST